MAAETGAARRPYHADGQAIYARARKDPIPPFSPTFTPIDEVVTIMDTPHATNHNKENLDRFFSAARSLTEDESLDPQLSERVLRFVLARDWKFTSLLVQEITGEDFLAQTNYRLGFEENPGKQPFDNLVQHLAQRAGVEIDPIRREIAAAAKVDEVTYELGLSGHAIWEEMADGFPEEAHRRAEKALKGLIDLENMPDQEHIPDDAKGHLFETLDRLRHMSTGIGEVREVLEAHSFEELAQQAEITFDRSGFEYRELLRTRAELVETNPNATEQIAAINAKLEELRREQITS